MMMLKKMYVIISNTSFMYIYIVPARITYIMYEYVCDCCYEYKIHITFYADTFNQWEKHSWLPGDECHVFQAHGGNNIIVSVSCRV